MPSYRQGTSVTDRGHWFVAIRPRPYVNDRVTSFAELERIAADASVRVRGWDYPHVDFDAIKRQADHVAQITNFRLHHEEWRLYQSGQFACATGLIEDWVEAEQWGRLPADVESQPYLGVGEALLRLVEIFHLAANLASGPLGTSETEIQIRLGGSNDRQLYVDDPTRWPFSTVYRAAVESVEHTVTVASVDLIGAVDDLTLEAALRIFGFFRWDPKPETVAELINHLRSV